MHDFYVAIVVISSIQRTYGCIPMHVDEPVTPGPTPMPTTTLKPDPCKGCVPPGVRSAGWPARCAPDVPGTVAVAMVAQGDKCILSPTGCTMGYYFVLNENQCSFTTKPGSIPNAVCSNGNFYYGGALIHYFVGGCSTLFGG